MKRKLFVVAGVHALVVAAALAAVWPLSNRYGVWFNVHPGESYWMIYAECGELRFGVIYKSHRPHGLPPPPLLTTHVRKVNDRIRRQHTGLLGGFGYTRGRFGRGLSIPIWFAVLVVALSGLFFLRQLRRRRIGRCYSCGYDLRGSPGDCPECGAARPPAA